MPDKDIRTLFDSDDDSSSDSNEDGSDDANGAGETGGFVHPQPFDWMNVDPGYLEQPTKRTLCCTGLLELPIGPVPICVVPYTWGQFYWAGSLVIRVPTVQSTYSLEIVNVLGEVEDCRDMLLWVCLPGPGCPRYVGRITVE